MDQVQVDVVEAEAPDRLVGGHDRVVVRVVPAGKLAGHPELRTGYAGPADRLAHRHLVAVVDRGVEQPVARVDRAQDRLEAVGALQADRAEADCGQLGAVIEVVDRDLHGGDPTENPRAEG